MSYTSSEIDYSIKNVSHSTYEYSQIFKQDGINDVILNQSGGNDTLFQIPVCAYNLAQSYLNFTLSVNALTAVANNSLISWVYVDGLTPIRQLQMYDDGGQYYANIYDLNIFTNMTMRYTTNSDELITNDRVINYPTATYVYNAVNGFSQGILEGINPTGLVSGSTTRPSGGAPVLGMPVTATVNTSYSHYEPMYLTAVTGADNSTFNVPILQWRVNLRKIPHSIFNIDKTLYFGKIMYLRVVWASTNMITYYNEGLTATGTVLLNNPGRYAASVPTTNTSGVTITNLYLYLAKERNILVENELKNKINSASGFKLYIPWIQQFKQSQTASSQSITLRLTNALGKRLIKIYWAPYQNSNYAELSYDHNVLPTDAPGENIGAANSSRQKIQSFYTMVNNVRTSQYDYSLNNGSYISGGNKNYNDAFDAIKERLKGSSIFSRNEFCYNFIWCEDFTAEKSFIKQLTYDESTMLDGLDLSEGEIKYDLFVNQGGTAISVYYYVYVVTLKELTITSSGITFV